MCTPSLIGDVELKAHIAMFQFQGSPSQTAQQPLDCDTSLESILETVSGDITFTGCGRCAAELDTDANGIYCPCYPCLPHTGVRRYYRSVSRENPESPANTTSSAELRGFAFIFQLQ